MKSAKFKKNLKRMQCGTFHAFSNTSKTIHKFLKTGVRWYGHVLRMDDGHVLRKALDFEVKGKRKRGLQRKTWRSQVEKESKSVGLKKEDAKNRKRWRVGVGEIAGRVG